MIRPFAVLAFLVSFSLAAAAQGPQSVADIAVRLTPAVVNISTTQTVSAGDQVPMPDLPENSPFRQFFDDYFRNQQRNGTAPEPRKIASLGSGFVIDPSGLIVTNNHVVDESDDVEVTFADGTKLKARILGKDSKTDLALLKVESPKPLAHVSFGNSDQARVGDWVIAVGNPFGLGGSVTLGIISARNRDINAGAYDDFIQTDAAINRGNSGGPLFDLAGNVVGVNTAIISPSGGSIGIGFAVPANTAVPVIEQLKQFGETRRGWIGVKIQQVTPEIADTLQLGSPRGALVSEVTPSGPAEKAGLKAGDVIVAFDGQPVHQMRELPRLVANAPVGRTVPLTVLRGGKETALSVTLGRLEEGEKLASSQGNAPDAQPAPASPTAGILGLSLSPLTDDLRSQYSIPEGVDGAVVTDVAPGSAAQDRVEPGDVITEAGNQPVKRPEDVQKRVAELQKQGRANILLLLSKTAQAGEKRFVPLPLK